MDSMPFFELHKICRICLKNDLLVSIFSPTFIVPPIEMIEKLNLFKYNPEESLPTLLCQSCLYRLLDAYNLQQLSESSENRLRDYLLNATGNGACSLSMAASSAGALNHIALNKILDNHESSCFSSTSANDSQDIEEAADSSSIYENIYDMFEPNASNDIEVEDDVLNDVVIDVSSLTRSEAEEDTLSDLPTQVCAINTTKLGLSSDDSSFNEINDNQSKKLLNTADNDTATNSIQIKPASKALKIPEKCLECGKTFAYSGYLEVHARTHTGEKPFKCKLCPRRFTQSGNLMLHTRTHTGERRFQCEQCASFFTTSSNLKAHKLTHVERREFTCQKCPLQFKTQRDLKKHEPVHKTVKDIICSICQKAFVKSSYLSAHMAAVHRGVRKHSCPECERVFGTRSNLVCHMRTHNGEKPYQCKHCSWKFNQSSALNRHMKKHAGKNATSDSALPSISNESLMSDYLTGSKLTPLPDELIIEQESPQLVSPQTTLPIMNSLSQLNPQLMEVTGSDFTISATAALHSYDFSKETILDFSTN